MYETGYYGVPGSYRVSMVHLVRDGRPVCGFRPVPASEFQWCCHGINIVYLRCPRCLEHAERHYLKLAKLAGKVKGKLATTTRVIP